MNGDLRGDFYCGLLYVVGWTGRHGFEEVKRSEIRENPMRLTSSHCQTQERHSGERARPK